MNALKSIKVVLVDDSEDTRHLLTMVLRRKGASVLSVESVDEGLKTIESFRPDVVVSDLHMPDRDGYSLIKSIRYEQRYVHLQRIPVLAISADGDPVSKLRAYSEGFDGFLSKPLDFNEFVAAVRDLASQSAYRRALGQLVETSLAASHG